MDSFIHEGFWVLLGILVGVGGSYVPLAKSISKVREDAVMKGDCEKLSELRAKPTAQAIEKLSSEIAEVKADIKQMRNDLGDISRHLNGRDKK